YSLVSLFFAFSYFFFFVLIPLPQLSPLFPYTTLFRSPNLSFSSSVLVPYTLSPMRVRIMIPITGFGTTCWYFTETRTTASSPLRSEEHTSELQSRFDLVCRLLLEKKKKKKLILL